MIYILDTGVRITHGDFGGRAKAGWSAGCPTGSESECGDAERGWLFEGVVTADKSQCNGHGTHCASTAGGSDYGVAECTTIVTVQVLSCGGSGSISGVIAGIEWAVTDSKTRGPGGTPLPAVISMSLGGSGAGRYDAAIDAAFHEGVITVVAAGNSDDDACEYSPASTPNAITVGSTALGDGKSGFSNHGSCVDIHAPGSIIAAAWVGSDSDTRSISGTSMACPHVAGVAAQIRGLHPSMGPGQLTSSLLCLATTDIVTSLPSGTVNNLLYNDLDDPAVANCLEPLPPASPPAPSPPPVPGATCDHAQPFGDGVSGNIFSYDVPTTTVGIGPPSYDASLCPSTAFTGTGSVFWLRLDDVRPGVALELKSCGFDTDLSVFKGSCGNLEMVECDGDSGGNCGGAPHASKLSFTPTDGVHWVVVGGWNGAAGSATVTATYSGAASPSPGPSPSPSVSPSPPPPSAHRTISLRTRL